MTSAPIGRARHRAILGVVALVLVVTSLGLGTLLVGAKTGAGVRVAECTSNTLVPDPVFAPIVFRECSTKSTT
jgi:hypothetical protein